MAPDWLTPTLLVDFDGALRADRAAGLAFGCQAFRVFGGYEPPATLVVSGTTHAADYVLKALKWIWAQEDLNYPIPRYQGRLMAGFRLQELLDGVPFGEVYGRAEVKRSRPRPLPNVDYARVERALRGEEP